MEDNTLISQFEKILNLENQYKYQIKKQNRY